MESKRQTAVEWFAQRIQSDKIFSFDVVLKQAIQMEREQIVSAVHYGIRSPYTNIQTIHAQIEITKGEQYYNDTYGTKPSR